MFEVDVAIIADGHRTYKLTQGETYIGNEAFLVLLCFMAAITLVNLAVALSVIIHD